MVEKGEETVVVDQKGRMVLPSRLREKLGVKKGGRLSIRSEGSRRIIMERKNSEDVEERVRNWVKVSLRVGEKGSVGLKNPISNKWMSSEYARRKLGL